MFRSLLFTVLVLVPAVLPAQADTNIVVLTQTPVAEFSLPDGSVLHNAYVWRRNSQGIMILHDGGNFFLNYKLLPPDWQAAYLGEPEPVVEVEEVKPVEIRDYYEVGDLLEAIPGLDAATLDRLMEQDRSEELDRGVLVLGLLQSMLELDSESATRLMLFIEEKGYSIKEVAADLLFESCSYCSGDGSLDKACKACSGSGKCPDCKGSGAIKGQLRKTSDAKKSEKHCTACRGTGACAACDGKGKFSSRCPKCKQSGKVVNRIYCEILRDKWVRQLNAAVTETPEVPVIANPSGSIRESLEKLDVLDPAAIEFFFSEGYSGEVDKEILMACVMHMLLEDDLEGARRATMLLELEFSQRDAFDLEVYLKPCSACNARGQAKEKCSDCSGKGKCFECEGTGFRGMALGKNKAECSDCDGAGVCGTCEGERFVMETCTACGGRGRILQEQRCEIKLKLLVDALNKYYAEQSKDAE